MGDHKRIMCKAGLHTLTQENLYYNAEGFRECRACKIYRESKRRAEKRKANKAAQEVSDAEMDRRALVMMGRLQDAR
jgi:hypothetical protein